MRLKLPGITLYLTGFSLISLVCCRPTYVRSERWPFARVWSMSLWGRDKTLNWCSLAFHRGKETHAPHGHRLHRTWVTADLSGHQPAFLPAKLPRHKHAANTQINAGRKPSRETEAWEQEPRERAEPGERPSEEIGMKLPEEKETDMTEQVLVHERENPTLKLQETPQSLRDREKKEKMKDGVRDAEGEGVHSVSSHIRCLDSRPRSFKKNGIEAEKNITFLCSMFGIEPWSIHSSLPLMW